MATLAQAFAGVHWLWVLKGSVILSCLNIFRHGRVGMRRPSLPADLGFSVLMAACWLVFLKLSHASVGAAELILTFFLAWVTEDFIGQLFSKLGANRLRS
jgi:hypothetical protein